MRDYVDQIARLRECASNSHEVHLKCGAYLSGVCAKTRDIRMQDAADAIEELLAKDTNVPNKWISVKERLPEESGYTIIFCADGDRGHVTFGKFLKTPKLWELSGARSYWRVLWWMPLPEPPKEVE